MASPYGLLAMIFRICPQMYLNYRNSVWRSIHATIYVPTKKIIPALERYPGHYIVTTDDDVYYAPNWLKELTEAHVETNKEVICNRAHRITTEKDGNPQPYNDWLWEVDVQDSSKLHFPTGVGGVLYGPGLLHPDVTDQDKFLTLCPTGDDIWLYWMSILNGAKIRRAGPAWHPTSWRGSQKVNLGIVNTKSDNGNDVQISRMLNVYGFANLISE